MKNMRSFIALVLPLLTLACGRESSQNYGHFTRAELRPYAYAPPLIPHKVLDRKCLNCHAQGLVVEGFKAPVTPHPELVNCQQCHVHPDEQIELFARNAFAGMREPVALQRPQPAGPPLIPHRVFMREPCLVCHNDPSRREITRTTHPERLNCLQCHVEQNREVTLFRNRASR
ncbi:MAG: multiheme c-type cytochrome [bacterium]